MMIFLFRLGISSLSVSCLVDAVLTPGVVDRRGALMLIAGTTAGDWRSFTALAPLGPKESTSEKTRHLPIEKMAEQLLHDVTNGATGNGGYLITGDLDPRLFEDTARFVDPTNDVASLSRYRKALTLLFDSSINQNVQLIQGPIIDPERRSISALLHISEGILKLPWHPRVRPFDTQITWVLADNGLVTEQSQLWSISATDALLQTFSLPPLHPLTSSPKSAAAAAALEKYKAR